MPLLQLPFVREEWIPIELYPELSVRNLLNYSYNNAYAPPNRAIGASKCPIVMKCHACISPSDRHSLCLPQALIGLYPVRWGVQHLGWEGFVSNWL